MIDDLKDEKKNSNENSWELWAIIVMSIIFGHRENWFRNDYHEIKEGEENND